MFLYKLINYLHKPVLLVCWPDHNSCRIAPPHHPDRSSHRTADTEWLPDRACSYQGDTHCTVFGLSTLQKKIIIIITRFRFSCVVLVYTFSAKIWLCQDRPEIAYLVQTFQLLPCVCTRGVYLVPGPYWGWISLVPGTQKVHPWQVHPTPRKVHPLEGVVNSCHGLVSWTSW